MNATNNLRFESFPSGTLKFLSALSRNNDREWFQPRKREFEELVREPLLRFAEMTNAMLIRNAPEYSVIDPQKALNRIYRDIRFSANKAPYNDHVSFLFPNQKLGKKAGAALYFHLSGKESTVAGGLYFGETPSLQAVREHIAARHAEFRKILAAKQLHRTFGDLEGDSLQKVPKQFGAEHPAADLLKRKQWLFHRTSPARGAIEPGFAQEALQGFKLLLPFIQFLNSPLLAMAAKTQDPLL